MKKNILKKNKDFQKVLFNKKNISNDLFKVFYKTNNLNYLRFGIAVNHKRIKLAVIRNKYKRWTRSIVNKNINLNLNFDIVIKVLDIKNITFEIFEKKLISLIKKINSIKR